jgi:hypothetical protein
MEMIKTILPEMILFCRLFTLIYQRKGPLTKANKGEQKKNKVLHTADWYLGKIGPFSLLKLFKSGKERNLHIVY